jgi:hypothetical protein
MTQPIRKPEAFFGETPMVGEYLLLGIILRLLRRKTKQSQATMARKFGMKLEEYKKVEEAVHAPDCEKTLKIERGGLYFTPYDARTRISREIVDLLLPRGEGEE